MVVFLKPDQEDVFKAAVEKEYKALIAKTGDTGLPFPLIFPMDLLYPATAGIPSKGGAFLYAMTTGIILGGMETDESMTFAKLAAEIVYGLYYFEGKADITEEKLIKEMIDGQIPEDRVILRAFVEKYKTFIHAFVEMCAGGDKVINNKRFLLQYHLF